MRCVSRGAQICSMACASGMMHNEPVSSAVDLRPPRMQSCLQYSAQMAPMHMAHVEQSRLREVSWPGCQRLHRAQPTRQLLQVLGGAFYIQKGVLRVSQPFKCRQLVPRVGSQGLVHRRHGPSIDPRSCAHRDMRQKSLTCCFDSKPATRPEFVNNHPAS